MDSTTVTLEKSDFENLLRAKLKLEALDAAGVDNWDWYDAAMEEYEMKLKAANLSEE